MRKLLILLVGTCVAYFAYGAHMFSASSAQRWIADHDGREWSGSDSACEDYADDVEVSVVAEGPKGRWEVEGGKEEICGYIKSSSAAYTVLDAESSTQYEDLSIQHAGFPWRSAVITFKQQTEIRVPEAHLPPMVSSGEEEITLQRTFSGLRIVHLKVNSHMVMQ